MIMTFSQEEFRRYNLFRFYSLIAILVSEIMSRFRKNIRFFSKICLFMTSGDLNIDLSEKLTEVLSECFLTSYRLLFSPLLYDVWESS